jgi:HemY protein
MRALAWLLAAFGAAVALAVLARATEGVVVLVLPPWRIEASVVLAAFVLLAAFALAYALLRLLKRMLALPAEVRAFRERRRQTGAQRALAAALQAYYEGRYARAEREATLAWEAGAAPALAALVGARAAHQLRERERRERWLDRAGSCGPAFAAATLLARAEFALEERDFAAARDALKSLAGSRPRSIAAARMLLRAERGLQNWEEVLRLATLLGKRAAIPPAVAEEHRVQAHVALLERAAGDRAALAAYWKRIAPADRVHARVAAAAARVATAAGDAALAREAIEASLAKEWTDALAEQYAELPALEAPALAAEARARLERAERWLAARPRDPKLLLALGRLCQSAGLWGKARDYLEASLAFESSRAAHLALARLADREGRAGEAERHHRMGAELP